MRRLATVRGVRPVSGLTTLACERGPGPVTKDLHHPGQAGGSDGDEDAADRAAAPGSQREGSASRVEVTDQVERAIELRIGVRIGPFGHHGVVDRGR